MFPNYINWHGKALREDFTGSLYFCCSLQRYLDIFQQLHLHLAGNRLTFTPVVIFEEKLLFVTGFLTEMLMCCLRPAELLSAHPHSNMEELLNRSLKQVSERGSRSCSDWRAKKGSTSLPESRSDSDSAWITSVYTKVSWTHLSLSDIDVLSGLLPSASPSNNLSWWITSRWASPAPPLSFNLTTLVDWFGVKTQCNSHIHTNLWPSIHPEYTTTTNLRTGSTGSV